MSTISLHQYIDSWRHAWTRALLAGQFFRWMAISLWVCLAYAIADVVLGLSTQARTVLSIGVGIALFLLLVVFLVIALLKTRREAAERMDEWLGRSRRDVLAAWELTKGGGATTPLGRWLSEQQVASVEQSLQHLRRPGIVGIEGVRRDALLAGITLIVMLGLMVGFRTHTATLWQRLVSPHLDTPPASDYTFHISPALPVVLYGEDLDLEVRIDGAELTQPVEFLVRNGDEVRAMPTYLRGDRRYSRRLEQVVEPVQVAFRTGGARSHWLPVDVRMEPLVAEAHARLTPPAYCRQPERRLRIGETPLSGLANTEIELEVTSNRPLSGGRIVVYPMDLEAPPEPGSPQVLAVLRGTPAGGHVVRFSWRLQQHAQLALWVTDVRGTESRTPYIFRQALTPDRPPEVTIVEPQQTLVMATPDALIPLIGEARDDLGLRQMELLRGLQGFRDRPLPLSVVEGETLTSFQKELNLAEMGVVPGQTIELYLEARDTNPNLLGVAASPITQIQIISTEEYAANLRRKVDHKAFLDRYRAAQRALGDLQETVEKLHKLLQESGTDPQEASAALDAVKTAQKAAADKFKALAEDFPVYEQESAFQQTLSQLAEEAAYQHRELAQYQADAPDLPAYIAAMRERMKERQQAVDREVGDAEKIAMAMRMADLARGFDQLRNRQENLVRRLQRYETERADADPSLLPALAAEQETLRGELDALLGQMSEAAQDLADVAADDATLAKLVGDTLSFVRMIQGSGIDGDMRQATSAAQDLAGRRAHTHANTALTKMQRLPRETSNENMMSSMCEGQAPGDGQNPGWSPGMSNSLQQYLDRFGMMPGMNEGGPGQGVAGTRGSSPLDTPAYGPKRRQGSEGAGDTPSQQEGGTGSGNAPHIATGTTQPAHVNADNREDDSTAVDLSQAPPAYRDAIRRFFQIPATDPSATNPERMNP